MIIVWWLDCAISSFCGDKTPCEKTKSKKMKKRHAKRRNKAMQKDETRHAKRRIFSAKRRKKTPLGNWEKTPFETLTLSYFRMASFYLSTKRFFVISPGVIS